MAPKPDPDEATPSRLKIVGTLGYLLVGLLVTFLVTAIQTNEQKISNLELDFTNQLFRLENDLEKLEASVDTDIDALLESNRNRRNSIAIIEADVAALRAKVDLLLAAVP